LHFTWTNRYCKRDKQFRRPLREATPFVPFRMSFPILIIALRNARKERKRKKEGEEQTKGERKSAGGKTDGSGNFAQ